MKMNSKKTRLIMSLSVLLMLSMIFYVPQTVNAQSTLRPSSVSISGSIVDNYANVSYELLFDNTASEEAVEIEWYFGLSAGVRLSNISLLLGDLRYWGKAKPESQAIHEYNETVQQNKTGVLVRRIGSSYKISFNIENGTEATLTVYAEGLLTRSRGLYTMDFPITSEYFSSDFSFDITVVSHFGFIDGYNLKGITSFNVDDLPNGIRITHSKTGSVLPSSVSLTYFTERQIGGSQLLTYNNGSQNFFMYLLAPSSNESESVDNNMQFVFVIDISGSMSGTKISQTKIAFTSMIETLNSNDQFNIVVFESSVDTLWAESRFATTSNVDAATDYVQGLNAGGGTNFHGGCLTGLSLFTDNDDAKVMMVLSDGEPTAGVTTDPDEIESAILEANTMGVSISTIAFGQGANQEMMSNIAAQNNGAFIFVSDNDEAATKILDFYYQYSTPLAYNYSIAFSGEIEFNSRRDLEDTPFFNGSEVVICGRYYSSISIDTLINYVSGPETYHNSAGAGNGDYPHVAYAWAQTKIDQLIGIVNRWGETEELRNNIVSLALEYGLIVEGYTAIILKVDEPIPTTTTESQKDYYGWGGSTTQTAMTTSYGWTSTGSTGGHLNTGGTNTHPPGAAFDSTNTGAMLIGVIGIGGIGGIIVLIVILKKYRFSSST